MAWGHGVQKMIEASGIEIPPFVWFLFICGFIALGIAYIYWTS